MIYIYSGLTSLTIITIYSFFAYRKNYNTVVKILNSVDTKMEVWEKNIYKKYTNNKGKVFNKRRYNSNFELVKANKYALKNTVIQLTLKDIRNLVITLVLIVGIILVGFYNL